MCSLRYIDERPRYCSASPLNDLYYIPEGRGTVTLAQLVARSGSQSINDLRYRFIGGT
jgi:hypothetical protein